MTARLTALQDQAAAADAEAAGFVRGIAEIAGDLELRPAHYRVLERMHTAIVTAIHAGLRPQCRHLDLGRPEVCYWHPWAPERQVCQICSERLERQMVGTAEAFRCDLCQRYCPGGLDRGLVSIRSFVDEAERRPIAMGAALVPIGLCDHCLR